MAIFNSKLLVYQRADGHCSMAKPMKTFKQWSKQAVYSNARKDRRVLLQYISRDVMFLHSGGVIGLLFGVFESVKLLGRRAEFH